MHVRPAKDVDVEDLPIGCLVKTPSGRVGLVIKHQGAQSKQDHFQRVMLRFNEDPRDSVLLQPQMLERINRRTPSLTYWATPEGDALMRKLQTRKQLTEGERLALDAVLQSATHNPDTQAADVA